MTTTYVAKNIVFAIVTSKTIKMCSKCFLRNTHYKISNFYKVFELCNMLSKYLVETIHAALNTFKETHNSYKTLKMFILSNMLSNNLYEHNCC